MARLAIPAEIKRAVLVEAGHRCAIPRCGETELEIHHIVPWETCQKHEYMNLIALCLVCHRRVHKGEIDRKSLFHYKAALIKSNELVMPYDFEAKIVEIRRRISEIKLDTPGYYFDFDFPDFQEPAQRIVSKNLEAWGYELLATYRNNQDSYIDMQKECDEEIRSLFTNPSQLKGTYRVARNDDVVISVEYTLDQYFTGAAHGGRHTHIQNFLIKPFQPITLLDLLAEKSSITKLSSLVREKLLSVGRYDKEWLFEGTEPEFDNFSKFVLDNNGVRFLFDEYQIDCYAAGRQKLLIGYEQLEGIANPLLLSKIKKEWFD